MKKRKGKKIFRKILGFLLLLVSFGVLAAMFYFGKGMLDRAGQEVQKKETQAEVIQENEAAEDMQEPTPQPTDTPTPTPEPTPDPRYTAVASEQIQDPDPEKVMSRQLVLIDETSNTILAGRDYEIRMNPASMTKVLTLLVACEHVRDLEDTVTMTEEMIGYCVSNGLNSADLAIGETVTVRDLMYGTILPSGGEAAAGLAVYTAGSMEAFVDLMNQKLEEMGLSETSHFTDVAGRYSEDHYSTVKDIAIILRAAMENEMAREVLTARTYTTTVTENHPEGAIYSNWFIRRCEDQESGGTVIGAKTGFVNESGNCAVSYFTRADGRNYICATGGSDDSWQTIYDHCLLYKDYTV